MNPTGYRPAPAPKPASDDLALPEISHLASTTPFSAVLLAHGAGLAPADARLAVATAKAHNSEVLGQVVDDSIEASARARRQREADDAERRAEEARQAHLDEIERRERAEAEALAEESRRAQEESIRRAEENKAWIAEIKAQPPPPVAAGPLDLSA